jgi:predicted DsbA family dithiol-disulfide isomerase
MEPIAICVRDGGEWALVHRCRVRTVRVTLYTDPGCPFGFNAQRQELQLMWHYGHAAQIERRMIVLQERSVAFGEDVHPTAEMVARGRERLRELYGMPMGLEPVPRLAATIEACRAYAGARMRAPERALALLRSLRRRAHSDQQPLDDPETIAGAARDAGLEPELVESWRADDEVEAALRADMAATRDPLPEALALPHRLSRSDRGLRYSTSSGVYEHERRRVVVAGFQPFAVYEVAMANVAPHVERRPAPETVEEVLAWAPFGLATAEVAELRGIELRTARHELERAGATFTPSANDGYWHA